MRVTVGCWILAVVVASAAACGKRGNPLPPLRPIPGAIANLEAWRIADRLEIRFTVPAANADNSTPSAVERIEVYMIATPATVAAPAAASIVAPANLKAALPVAPTDAPAVKPPPGTALPPAPGETTRFVDRLPTDKMGTSDAPTWHYVLVAASGRRRGALSPVISIPMVTAPATPSALSTSHDETTLKLTWKPGDEGKLFRVYEVAGAAGKDPKPLTPAPIEAAEFTTKFEFGKEHCFSVSSVRVTGKTTIEGALSEAVCVTPADKFPPPAPGELSANLTAERTVILSWAAVAAADLAGYIVLRNDGTSETLQRLMTEPIAATTFEDKTVRSGLTYVYAVIAVDKSSPPNTSPPSETRTVTVR